MGIPKIRGGDHAIAINGSGGAYVSVSASQSSRRAVIKEDPSESAAGGGGGYQGWTYQRSDDNYVQTIVVPADGTEVPIEQTSGVQGSGCAPVIGMKAQNNPGDFNYIPATEYLRARSLSATATKLMVIEEA